MFEFKVSYKEEGYHKEGDEPFKYPPGGNLARIDANLIEVQGQTGTGKTTFLNVLALALGYLEHKEELKGKPILTRKLQELNKNNSLEYHFDIRCGTSEQMDLKIGRSQGKQQRCWLNSRAVDPDTISRDFDVIYLTEDDPEQVVTNSLRKLADYFRVLDNGLLELLKSLNIHVSEIEEFHKFEASEKNLLKEIEDYDKKIKENNTQLSSLNTKVDQLKQKAEVDRFLDLIKRAQEITDDYKMWQRKFEDINDKGKRDLATTIRKEENKWFNANNDLEELSRRARQTCQSLSNYGVILQVDKLLEGDHHELNEALMKAMRQRTDSSVNIGLVKGMIQLLNVYPQDENVPVINRKVGEVMRELWRLTQGDESDRVSRLLTTLREVLSDRDQKAALCERINEKIAELKEKGRDLENIEKIEQAFATAENEYNELQKASKQDRIKLARLRSQLRLVEGNPEQIAKQIDDFNGQIRDEGLIKQKLELKLENLRENNQGKPDYEDKERKLQSLIMTVSSLRENTYHWMQILQDPVKAGKDFASLGNRPGFGLAEYRKFVDAVGESIGKQFEPVAFDYKMHDISFFDIEKKVFITKEGRKISLDALSTGQRKVTALAGIFKKLDPSKKKIVLVDEISVVDPKKVEDLKKTLKEEFDKGSVILSVLLRPSAEVFETKAWG